jgi:hypothetical protein
MRPSVLSATLKSGSPIRISSQPRLGGCTIVIKIRAIFVVVGDVHAEQAFQRAFVDGNDGIQEVTAAAAQPALRDPLCQGLSKEVRSGLILRE